MNQQSGQESNGASYEQLPVAPGKVRTFLSWDVSADLPDMRNTLHRQHAKIQSVAYTWTQLPAIETIIENLLDAIAATAQASWPNWYQGAVTFKDGESPDNQFSDDRELDALLSKGVPIQRQWVRKAVRYSRVGKPPRLRKFAQPLEAAQLALAINRKGLCIFLAVEDRQPQPEMLYGLAQAAQWFAQSTHAGIAVLLPRHVGKAEELERILYGVVNLPPPEAPEPQPVPPRGEEPTPEPRPQETKDPSWTVHGRPHPNSPGEQLLAKWLAKDDELHDLFYFNQSVTTTRDSRYLVDLIWADGKVVVEVDGYWIHSQRAQFIWDRHRDYELAISGYAVLRLAHDQVMDDVEIAIEKIRDVVAFRRVNMPKIHEVTK